MRRPPRIVVLDFHTRFLGAQRVLVDFLASVGPALDIHVVTTGEPTLAAEIDRLGVPMSPVSLPDVLGGVPRTRPPHPREVMQLPGVVREVKALLRRLAPDVVVANTPKAHVIGALTAPKGARFLIRLHDILPPSVHVRALVRGPLRRADSVACVSDAVAVSAVRLGFPAGRVVTVRNGIPPGRPEAEFDGRVRCIGVVAQLEPWKGQDLVLEAFAQARRTCPDLTLRVVGAPVKRDTFARHLARRAQRLGVAADVEFIGHLKGREQIYRGMDLLMHLPRSPEPLATVLLEAMAWGVPVIAARNGGTPEIIRDGFTGLLVDTLDVDGAARAIERLVEAPTVAMRLRDAALTDVGVRFDLHDRCQELAAWMCG